MSQEIYLSENNCRKIDRIADALDSIANSLEKTNPLQGSNPELLIELQKVTAAARTKYHNRFIIAYPNIWRLMRDLDNGVDTKGDLF